MEIKAEIYDTHEESIVNASNKNRFIVIKESTSWHCCFTCTVIDTKAGKEDYGDYWKRSMCETFGLKEAIEICTLLNKS